MTSTASPPAAAPARAETAPRPPAFDPGRLLSDPDGCAVLTEVVGRLRAAGYDAGPDAADDAAARGDTSISTLVALAGRRGVTEPDAVAALGVEGVGVLLRCGLLVRHQGELVLTARLFPMRSIYTLLPSPHPDQDIVYLGPDSHVLFETVWAARGFGDRAVDLATGNGFLAAALATRYDHVIAADLSRRCVTTAALVPVVNPHLRTRVSVVQMDVAEGLQPGAFDLVTANPPWVPETVGPDGGPSRRFAAGGPTGFELPRRFIDAAADLLAPGGRAFVACLDIVFADGRRPLAEHLPQLTARGFDVTIFETRLNGTFDYGAWAAGKAPHATAARHVIVDVRRPPRG